MRSNSILIVVVLVGFLILTSCGNDPKKVEDEEPVEIQDSPHFGVDDFEFPDLDNNSTLQVSQWPVFEDFDNEIRTINGRTREILKKL